MNLVAFVCLVAVAIAVYLGIIIKRQMGGSAFLLAADSAGSQNYRVPQGGFFANTLALPLAFLAGWVLKGSWWMFGFFFYVTCHELGHSLVAWMGGYWSFPVIVGIALVSPEPSYLVTGAMLLLLGWGLWTAAVSNGVQFFLLCACLAAGTVYLSFFASTGQWQSWMHFGGTAGEFVLPTLLILAFYHRFPDRLRWDFFRYPLLLAAMCSLVASAQRWHEVRGDPENRILWGKPISQSRDTDNDWVKLVRESGWTPQQIADSYANLGLACSGAVVMYYIWFLGKAPRRPEDAEAAAAITHRQL